MDLQMPEMDGYTATQLIRGYEDPKYKALPIIALTASAMKPIMSKVIEAGMNDFVSKPFDPQDLNRKISKYLKEKANTLPA
jgi:CheY-like chemotaxis protein